MPVMKTDNEKLSGPAPSVMKAELKCHRFKHIEGTTELIMVCLYFLRVKCVMHVSQTLLYFDLVVQLVNISATTQASASNTFRQCVKSSNLI